MLGHRVGGHLQVGISCISPKIINISIFFLPRYFNLLFLSWSFRLFPFSLSFSLLLFLLLFLFFFSLCRGYFLFFWFPFTSGLISFNNCFLVSFMVSNMICVIILSCFLLGSEERCV